MVDIIGAAKDTVLGGGSTPGEAWRTALLQASFGGAKFNYQSHSRSGGHRVNVIDYPESSQHDLEDMGPRNDSFQVAGYVIGSQYIEERDELLKQLKDSSAKDLVIPSEGIFRVKTTDWSLNETKEEQRIARFNMTFQIKETIEVLILESTKQTLFDKKQTLLDEISNWFADVYDITQKPVTIVNDAVSTVDKCLDVVRDAKRVTGSIPEFQRAVRELKGRTRALALNAESMVQDIGALINFGTDPSNQGRNTDTADTIDLDNSGTEQKRESKDIQNKMLTVQVSNAQEPSPLIQKMIAMQAIAAETGLFAVTDFDSPEQALEEERDLISRYDDLLDSIETTSNITDELYYAIRDAQQAVHEDLEQRVIRLPRLIIKQNNSNRNALELNFSTYGNFDEYTPFNKRNGIIHPAFIPAHIDLQYKVGGEDE